MESNMLSYKERIFRSLVINSAIFSMGVCEAVKGPTLLDLTEVLSTSITKVSLFFFAFSIGSLLGVVAAGVSLDRLSQYRYPILGLSGIGFGVTTICIPYTMNVYVLYANSLISGIFSGTLDAGCNVENLAIWRGHKQKGSWILSFSFSYAAGSFVAPLIARPFIGGKISQIWILYPIVGSIEIFITTSFFFLFAYDRWSSSKKDGDEKKACEVPPSEPSVDPAGFYYYCFLLTTWMFFFLQMGVVTGFGNYIATSAVWGPLQLSKRAGADMTAKYWASFTLLRFFSIFGARYVPPLAFILTSLCACVVGSGLAFWFPACVDCLVATCFIFGLGTSTLYASGLLWIEREGLPVTFKRGSFIFSGSAFGADAFPILIGQFIEGSPGVLMEIAFISSIVMASFFLLMMGFIKKVVVVKNLD